MGLATSSVVARPFAAYFTPIPICVKQSYTLISDVLRVAAGSQDGVHRFDGR